MLFLDEDAASCDKFMIICINLVSMDFLFKIII